MSAKSFVETIKSNLSELSPTERRLAEVLLDFPGELASYTASELAVLAGVSNATVTRFIRRLGYSSYEAARQQVRIDRRSGSALYLSRPFQDDMGELGAHHHQARLNIDSTFAKLSEGEIDAAAHQMVNAKRTFLIGSRVGRVFADYLGFQLRQVIDTVIVAPSRGEALAEAIADLGSEDVAIIFWFRRPSRQFSDLVEVVRNTGAKVLYITDESVERRSDVTWQIQCQTAALGPLFNHVAVTAVCHLIVSRVFASAGSLGRKRMRDIEAAHQALGDV